MAQAVEEQLSYLGFQLIRPCAALAPYVESYWLMQRAESLLQFHEEFMHPAGGFGIVFNLGDHLSFSGENLSEPVFLDGTNTVSRKVGFLGQVNALGIRFHTGGAYPFLEIPLNEIANHTVYLSDLGYASFAELHQRLLESDSLQQKIMLIEQYLLKIVRDKPKPRDILLASLEMIKQKRGQIEINSIADWLYISQRQLERLYAMQVGMSPKQYARLSRIAFARKLLKRPQQFSLAQISAELGFFDQAHFIREFKAVIGMTPQAYLKRNA